MKDWKNDGTARQVRRLLRWCNLDHDLIDYYPELAEVARNKFRRMADASHSKYDPYAAQREADLVDAVIDMRNAIVHPSVDGGAVLRGHALNQCWRVVTEWLTLSILFYIGYIGTYASRLTPQVRYAGQVMTVPWLKPTE